MCNIPSEIRNLVWSSKSIQKIDFKNSILEIDLHLLLLRQLHLKTRYCSKECRDIAYQTYHKVLCLGDRILDPSHPVNQLYDAWKHTHYPPETATISLLGKMIAMYKQVYKFVCF